MFVRQTLQSCLYVMRNVMLAGLAAVTTIFVVWSMSTFAKPKLVGKADASATIWPHEIMKLHGRNLLVEYWDPF
jgi:hypothetical protein